ncbi:hypothetical protein V8C37DRAFT_383975 [Trichoderma ceciliae]
MKSKRAAASIEDVKPVDVAEVQPAKKRKRNDEDAAPPYNSVKRSKKDKKDKKNKQDKGEKKPKKDKSKYNNKSRKEKKEKLKNLQDLPEGMDVDNDEGNTETAETTTKPETAATVAESKTNGTVEDKAAKKKEKKEKKGKEKTEKKEKKASQKEAKAEEPSSMDAIDLDASSAQKPGRNIVFVGNLPYSATAASITAHFASLNPIGVRCLTKKEDPKACRGIAFVEFGTPVHQRTCLDKFHHSTFEDGISTPRKINVELTAGGGGKSQGRQDKIMEKNKKLDENRAKRIEKEKTTKEETQSDGQARMDIHPSRLARLPGLGQ